MGFVLRRLLLLSMAILCFAGLSSVVTAETGPGLEWYLLTTHDDDVHQIGEQVNVTVHVFSEGEYADPPNITFLIGASRHEINITRVSEGLFIAQMTIASDDLDNDRFFDYRCYINGTDGEALGTDHGSIRTPLSEAMLVDLMVIDPADGNPEPGQVVRFLSRITLQGEPVDPDDVVGYYIGRGSWVNLIPTRLAIGLYAFNHTLPDTFPGGYGFNLVVEVNLTNDTRLYRGNFVKEFDVDVFRVWAEISDRSERGAHIGLWVTDLDGNPVEGAKVDLEASLYGHSQSEDVIINDTTDTQGRVWFNVSEYSRNGFYYFYVDGTITFDGMVQYVDERIDIAEQERDLSSSLVLEDDYDLPLEPDVTYMLGFHVEYERNHTAWADQTMYVYIYDQGSVYLNERLVTDENGDFSVNFRAPELVEGEFMRTVNLFVRTKGETYLYSDHDYLRVGYVVPFPWLNQYRDDEVDLEIEPLGPGRVVNVTLDHPGADGINETALVYWGPVPLTTYYYEGFYASDWELWSDWGRTVIQTIDCQWNGSAYQGSFTLPPHVPNRVELYVAGVIAFHGPDDWGRVAASAGPMVFVAEGPPRVEVDSPRAGETYSGTMTVTGRAFDDVSVVRVEVVVDELETWTASGTEEWSLELDTVKMGHGPHKIGVRAFDGISWSDTVDVLIKINQPPEVTSDNVPEDEFLRLPFNLTGSAEDDDGVVSVILSFDFDPTVNVTAHGTEEWWYVLDDDLGIGLGYHFIRVTVIDADGATGLSGWMVEFGSGGPIRAVITYPQEGDEANYGLTVEGTAAPTGGVVKVEVRVNGGDWVVASGAEEWSHDVETSSMKHGANVIEARAYDGQNYSSIVSVNFTFDGVPMVDDYNWTAVGDSIFFSGTATDDGDNLVKVEIRIDYGAWSPVNGTSEWGYELPFGTMTEGVHIAELRAYDGNHYSPRLNRTFEVNYRPNLTIMTGPTISEDGTIISLNGSASDNAGIVSISYRVDGGDWINISTSGNWAFRVDTTNMTAGNHSVEIRAFDGSAYSDTYTHYFEIEGETESDTTPDNTLVILCGVVVVLAVVLGVVVWRYRI